MADIICERTDSVLVIKMARAKANALNPAFVAELREAFREAAADVSVRAVVLASAFERIFSGGFDAKEVFPMGEAEIRAHFARFVDLYQAMLKLPKPLIAAVGGHAMAGGAVLALACDQRVMAEGDYGFSLNEVNLGISHTPGVVQMTINAAGHRAAWELLLGGVTIQPAECARIGLAVELAPAGTALDRALFRAKALGAQPAGAFADVKRVFREVALGESRRDATEGVDGFVRAWVSAESVELRRALTQAMGGGATRSQLQVGKT